ncbi:MAG: ankyrin repeat domain-containing protein [Rhabdochlamydiaceae bacterium]|nr:ankyrin repeat domain-containing protein [Rhabdochlamydiaceae bacterium]
MNTISLQKDFEKAISQGNVSLVQKSLSQGCTLDKLLPSGELPLNLAIRKDHPEITRLFLEKGANPLQKDIQRMQALDHASFSHNPLHKAHILSAVIRSNDLQKIQRQMQNKVQGSDAKLKNKINIYKTAGISFFTPPLGKEIYQGNLQNINKDNINRIDSNGLAPIHYAILGNQIHAVGELIALGADRTIPGPDGDSLLHIASMRNINPAILRMLLDVESGLMLNPNAKNAKGQTPMHYASIEDNLIAIRLLTLAGGNSSITDSQGAAPFAFIGAFVSDRDPLKLHLNDFLYPAIIGSALLLPIAIQNGWLSLESANQTAQTLMTIQTYLPKAMLAYVGLQIFGLQSISPSPPQERTGIYSNPSLLDLASFVTQTLFSSYLPSWAKTGLTLYNTYSILRNTGQGFQTCYQNLGYRNPLKIGIKALLHSISVTPYLLTVQQTASSYFQKKALENTLKEVPEALSAYKKNPKSADLKTKAGKNLFEYYTQLRKKPEDIKIESAELELWPSVEKDLTKKDLKTLWRGWSLINHPDKNKLEGADAVFKAAQNINECLELKLDGDSCFPKAPINPTPQAKAS